MPFLLQERQNKERNKASVSIEGFEKQPEKQKSEDVIKTVVPEDARPKFKPVGKIDLDKLNGRKPEKVEKEPEQKQEEPVVERPVVKPEVKKEPSIDTDALLRSLFRRSCMKRSDSSLRFLSVLNSFTSIAYCSSLILVLGLASTVCPFFCRNSTTVAIPTFKSLVTLFNLIVIF